MMRISSFSVLWIYLAISSCGMADGATLQPTAKMRTETSLYLRVLDELHYERQPFHSLDVRTLIQHYAEDLDYNHLFFLQSDIKIFEKNLVPNLRIVLRAGNLSCAFDVFNIYQNRAQARIAWVLKHLDTLAYALQHQQATATTVTDFNTSLDVFLRQLPLMWTYFECDPARFFIDVVRATHSVVESENYASDRQRAAWLSDIHDADCEWDRRLRHELLTDVMARLFDENHEKIHKDLHLKEQSECKNLPLSEHFDAAVRRLKKRYQNALEWMQEFDASEVEETFLNSLRFLYDPHTMFFSLESMDDFSITLRNAIVGIGVVLSRNEEGECVIREILPGGPVDKSKAIHVGDSIVAVGEGKDGPMVDIVGMKVTKAIKLIRGQTGSTVRLSIRPSHDARSTLKELTLTREEVKLSANLASAKLYTYESNGNSYKIGVIDLPTFYGPSEESDENSPSTTHDVEELIYKLKAQDNLDGIILDLRRNGGGLLDEAITLTGLFLPAGPVLQVRDNHGEVTESIDGDTTVAWGGPLIVLTAKTSASASEIVAGALKVNRRAVLVGDAHTHGKGTVQAIVSLDKVMMLPRLVNLHRLGSAKVTIQKWYLPDGSSTQLKGVGADVVLPSINDLLPIGESDLPSALHWDCIAPIAWDYNQHLPQVHVHVTQDLIHYLNGHSEQRQKTLEEFQFLHDRIARAQTIYTNKMVPLTLEKRQFLRVEDENFYKKFHEQRHAISSKYPLKYTSVNLDSGNKKESTPTKIDNDGTKNDFEDNAEDEILDIHLREGLRVMTDWIEYPTLKLPKTHTLPPPFVAEKS